MRLSHVRRIALGVGTAVTATAMCVALSPLSSAAPEASPTAPATPAVATAAGRYIVTLKSDPIASYDGGVAGLAATRPESGRKVDVTSAASGRYRAFLSREQDGVAARVGAKIRQRYAVTLNGFVASLTPSQARTLQASPGVVSVTKDVLRHTTDDQNSVDYLGLSGRGGLWSALGGADKAGRGVVVGVIDTGIWPESKSFAGAKLGTKPSTTDKYLPYRSGNQIVMQKSDGSTFHGRCQTGEDFTAADCSTKLVGARYFGDAFFAEHPETDAADYISPRDGDGHGSHTASTAAGDNGVEAVVDGRDFGKISGVAPAAKIAVYKALWTAPDGEGGFNSDIVAAIDAAVSDGVDVINFSVGSASESPTGDPISLAFLSAASAGIFVSASGGNNGPGASTLDNTSPWVTTVAASTIAPYYGTVALGNGAKYAGVSNTVTAAVGPAPLVRALDVKLATATDGDATLCSPGSLDPAKVAGKIVVCDRGVVARLAKSAEVKRAGGIGMVLLNLTENSLDADLHTVPTVIVNPPASAAIRTYAATSGATATLQPGNKTTTSIPYPQVAGFSSRGPSLANGGDLLKPDLAAPGVAILAAVAPPSNSGRNFDFYSGTSMAAPHVAGLATLFFGAGVHPHWSPMKVKSALMTTAVDTVGADGKKDTDPYAQGAGEVHPETMLNPGLVYNARDRDWLAYLEGLGLDTQTGVKAKDPSDYNASSIAIGELLDNQTVTRKVTAVSPGIYRATASVPGVKVTVTPSILVFNAKGETKSFTVRFQRTTAAYDQAATGFLTWRGAGTSVRSPVAVTPSRVSAPDEVTGKGAAGKITYQITPGVAGPFPITGYGLASGTAQTGSVTATGTQEFPTTIGAGAKVAQFTIRSPGSATGADADLYVYQVTPAGRQLVDVSAGSTADETVTLLAPAAGDYVAEVDGFASAPGTTETTFTFREAAVTTTTKDGNFTVTPANPTAVVGRPISVTASWSGVDPTTPYLGWVEYPGGSGTIVTIN